MTGKTHKAVGTAVGASMVLYGVMTEQPMYALGMVTAPLGAMLPDVDHCNTELGRANKKVFKTVRTAAIAVLLLSFLAGAACFVSAGVSIAAEWFLAVPASLAVIMVTSDGFKKKFPFLTKHRGIMHTLVIPACLIAGQMWAGSLAVKSLLLGLALGYISHLAADCMTVAGCPVCFPFSTECLIHGPIVTGTAAEYIGAAVLGCGICYYAYMLGSSAAAVNLAACMLLFLAGFGVMYKLRSFAGNRKASKVFKIVIVVFLIAAVALFAFGVVAREYTAAVVLGAVLSLVRKGRSHGRK